TFVATACAGHVTEFAECRLWGTRQRSICRVSPCRHSANKSSPHRNGRLRVGAVHVTVFTECQLAGTRQNVSLPRANWPALSKEIFRRVQVILHSAKNLALGIRGFSGSVFGMSPLLRFLNSNRL